jgi:hypothetical protein
MSSTTTVLITEKKNAKAVKVTLEKEGALEKSFRLSNLDESSFSSFISTRTLDGGLQQDDIIANSSKFIAIPIHANCLDRICSSSCEETLHSVFNLIIGHATQSCRYSSSVLGNTHLQLALTCDNNLNFVQNILLQAIRNYNPSSDEAVIFKMVDEGTNKTMPPKLEIMGDDRTLVIPFRALNAASDASFEKIIQYAIGENNQEEFMPLLWKMLADSHRSQRVVRRGEVDPNSKVRESGHSILWIDPEIERTLVSDYGE